MHIYTYIRNRRQLSNGREKKFFRASVLAKLVYKIMR